MPGRKLLMKPSNEVLVYDGSLAGFYSSVHACVYAKQMPLMIQPHEGMLSTGRIETDLEKATNVRGAICKKISPRALALCENGFLTCLPDKEIVLLKFIVLGFELGACVTERLTDPTVSALLKAERHLTGEAHLLTGFIRFSEHDGKLIATISPKNEVLPLIAPHFQDRYGHETLLIYDKTHQSGLICQNGRSHIGYLEGFTVPEFSEKEQYYQSLWKQFHQTIAIQGRINPRCQMSHMPKRYWGEMVEMKG